MKKFFTTLIQILVTILLLIWIFRDAEQRQRMFHAVQSAQFIWLVPGIICVGLMLLVQTERWRILLKVQGIQLSWWRVVRLNFVGAFFNLFLLGTTGGDVVKIFYLMKEVPEKKSSAFLSVIVDRVVGTLGIIVVALVMSCWRFQLLYSHLETQRLVNILIVILGSIITMLFFAFVIERLGWVSLLPKWMPFRAQIIELGKAFSLYAREGQAILYALGVSILGHIFIFLSYYFASLAFQSHLSLLDIFSVLPVVLVIASLPISLSGLGVREGLLQTMLTTLYGTSGVIGVLIAFTGFLFTMFWSLVGGAVYLFYRPTQQSHLQDIEKEVHDIEERMEQSP